jgi:hypothetical protein
MAHDRPHNPDRFFILFMPPCAAAVEDFGAAERVSLREPPVFPAEGAAERQEFDVVCGTL